MNRQNRYRVRRIRNRVFEVIVTLAVVAFCLGPLYWVLATSLKPMGTEYLIPPEFWPSRPSLQAYKVILGLGVPGEERESDAPFKGASEVTAMWAGRNAVSRHNTSSPDLTFDTFSDGTFKPDGLRNPSRSPPSASAGSPAQK